MSEIAAHRLSRFSHRKRHSHATLAEDLTLERGRVHEFCGTARKRLAGIAASHMTGPILWIHAGWEEDGLYPPGFRNLFDPSRLVFVTASEMDHLLWTMEEALRSGAAPLVICELSEPPGLTAVRRLHLAAEAGSVRESAPLGLLLTPGNGGAPGVETRWSLDPAHGLGGSERWKLARLRARMAPERSWALEDRNGMLKLNTKTPTLELTGA